MKLDLNTGVYIQIGGELGKYNSLPIDTLIEIAQDLQNLVITIAKYDLPTSDILDLNNFKIELFDFKKGSEETMGSATISEINCGLMGLKLLVPFFP